ncbi:MAG: protein-L-isoaspartate(D-aspartate) O-methyltransferase [Candidatus Hadarchaeota archaeon]
MLFGRMFREEREELVNRLVEWGYLKKPGIIAAFKKVPREEFIPENAREYAYSDQPLYIGRDQTISAPSMISIMMESLDLAKGLKVLEIGTGSGYNIALVAEVVGLGEVASIERIPELAKSAKNNLKKTGYDKVEVVVRDGTLGYIEKAPWDRILVTACAPEIPKPLLDQLKVGGKIGAPVGRDYMFQTWTVAEKLGNGKTKITEYGGCSFVPLVGKHGWAEED